MSEVGKTVCHGDLDRRNFYVIGRREALPCRLGNGSPCRSSFGFDDDFDAIHSCSSMGEWLDMYGLQLSTNIYQRIEWYALMNCLNYTKKKSHFEGRYLETEWRKILLVKSIYNNRIGKPTEE